MKVLLTNHFPFHGSGTGSYALDLAKALVGAGHQVECLIVDNKSHGDEPLAVERIVCRRGDTTADLPFDFPCFTAHPASGNTFYALTNPELDRYREATRRKLDRIIERFDPDVVHCQHIWIQAHLALESGAPYVVTAQGTDLMGYREDERYQAYANQAAENAGRIVAASEHIRREVLSLFDVAPERVVTVHNAIDASPFRADHLDREEILASLGVPNHAGPIVAFAGKLVPFKGVDTLLNAAAIYETDPAGITTIIAGDGIQRGELEAQARRLGLQRAYFLGDQDRARCALVYKAADVVVMPSRGEPFGLVALEALAAGTPVVGTRAGGLDEVLTDRVGGLVPVDDHELLAEMILRALAEDWKRTKADAIAEFGRRQSCTAWVERIVDIYRAVIDERFGRLTR